MNRATISGALALFTLCWCATASAELCTVGGSLRYQPTDLYYCDTARMTCSGWLQTDLDTQSAPVRFTRVRIRNNADTATFATVHTDGNGLFTATFDSSVFGAGQLCGSKQFYVRVDFLRADERDLASGAPRYRFHLVTRNDGVVFHRRLLSFAAGAASRNADFTQLRTAPSTDPLAHYYAVYHTMDSAMGEVIGWSTNLRDRLTATSESLAQPVVVDPLWANLPTTEAAPTQRGKIWMNYDWYRAGGIIRHEFGHWVHQLIHQKQQARGGCVDGRYPQNLAPPAPVGEQAHGVSTCEFGYLSTLEGVATFIGARSVTSTDTNVWTCSYAGGVADACSIDVAGRVGDGNSDGMTTGYQILGDSYADRPSRCAVLDSASCGCGAGCAGQPAKDASGFRVETQVARFMWDLIDTSSDSGAVDDVDYSMGGLVAGLEGMSCTGALGVEGTCNEATLSNGLCAKDKYNVYDIAAQLPTNESAERTLNCVQSALD